MKTLISIFLLCALPAYAAWNIVLSDGTNLTTRTATATNDLGHTASYAPPAYLASNNSFAGGTTQAFDQVGATNLDVYGTISEGGTLLSSKYVPQTRTITINGVEGTLSSNISFTVVGGDGGDVYTASNNTFAGENTFTQPVVVAYGTVSNHAARIDQINSFWEQTVDGRVVLKTTLVYDRWWTTNSAGSVILK